ncbi:MAG: hypothetical protein ABMA13_22950 [Chthoniobacteraceae bacterium]
MKLTPDDLARLEARQLANIIRKISAGKTPTAREAALLAQAKVGGAGDAPSAFAPTWDELADRLGTTRRSLQDWRKDPRYAPDCPKPQADGRLDVAAFAEWMVRHGLARADERVAGDDEDAGDDVDVIHPPRLSGSQSDWTKAVLSEKHASARLDRQTKEGTLLVAADLEIPLGSAFAAIQVKLAQFPATTARVVAGRRDVAEVEELLRGEMDIVLGELHGAGYLDTVPAELVAALPFDEQSAALCEKLLFAGADRTALLALVAHLVTEALRRIGRRALTTAPEILDAKTGQVTDAAEARQNVERASTAAAASADDEAATARQRKATRKSGPSKAGKAAAKKRKAPRRPAAPPADVEAISQVASPKRRRWKKRRKK